MELIVRRSTEIIACRVSLADSFPLRLRGLLGRRSLNPGEGLLLKPCCQVHTFFMAFPIDVLYLDGQGRILEVTQNLFPGRIGPWIKGSEQALELPAGVVSLCNILRGQVLDLEIVE